MYFIHLTMIDTGIHLTRNIFNVNHVWFIENTNKYRLFAVTPCEILKLSSD